MLRNKAGIMPEEAADRLKLQLLLLGKINKKTYYISKY